MDNSAMSTEPQRPAPASSPAQNTDRELWREPLPDPPGDYYANSLHVTAQGGIGINVGGTVIVLPLALWHAAGMREFEKAARIPSPDEARPAPAPACPLTAQFTITPAYLEELANALNGIGRQPQYHAQQLRTLAREMRQAPAERPRVKLTRERVADAIRGLIPSKVASLVYPLTDEIMKLLEGR